MLLLGLLGVCVCVLGLVLVVVVVAVRGVEEEGEKEEGEEITAEAAVTILRNPKQTIYIRCG